MASGPCSSFLKARALWVAAIPSLRTLYTSATTCRWEAIRKGAYSCRRGPYAQQEGALYLLLINVCTASEAATAVPCQSLKLGSGCCAQLCHQEEGLLGVSPYRGMRAGELGQSGVEWGQHRADELSTLPSLNNLRVKLQVVASWSQGPRSQFLF